MSVGPDEPAWVRSLEGVGFRHELETEINWEDFELDRMP